MKPAPPQHPFGRMGALFCCQICQADQCQILVDLGQQPLANKYPAPEEIATEEFHHLEVFFCPHCKNVQLGQLVSREKMFVDYYYLSSVNQGLVRHFTALAATLAKARLVVDIGSNDGILLKPLKDLGVAAIGVDPSINVSKLANDAGLTTLTGFFDATMAAGIMEQYGQPEVIVASSIFTHLENPHQCIEDIKSLLADDGLLIIEVEYIGNILQHVQFERFYFDRIFYYSLTSLSRLCADHGMDIGDVEMVEPHGGSLRVKIYKHQPGSQPSARVTDLLKKEEQAFAKETLATFQQTVDKNILALQSKLEEYQRLKLRVAGYGAPARVATICNYGKIGPELITFIVDDSPLKQHRYSPGTHIPIVPKDYLDAHQVDVLVTFAYEYLDDIRKKTKDAYRYLIPIPPREVA